MEALRYAKAKSDFSTELQARVEAYFKGLEGDEGRSKLKGGRLELAKAIAFAVLTVGSYGLLMLSPPLFLAIPLLVLLAFSILGLGLNALHEACHGNLSSKAKVNSIFAHGFDVVGGISAVQYRFKHTIHHRFTNLGKLDSDLDNVSILKLAPAFPSLKLHRFQHIYASVLYLLTTATWMLNDLERLVSKKTGAHKMPRYSGSQIAYQLIGKSVYIGLALVLPISVWGWAAGLFGFFFVHAVMGSAIALIFQVAHAVEDCEFPNDPSSHLPFSREEHQLQTTANFANGSFWDFWLGGLNYQIEHHLFPNVSYRHFPELSKIVRSTAEKHGVQYRHFPTFRAAIASHYQHLRVMGSPKMFSK